MNKIICSFHLTNQIAREVLEDSRNAISLISKDRSSSDAVAHIKDSALVFTLDRTSKTETIFVIERDESFDIVLAHSESSAKHCTVSISKEGILWLDERSTNDIIINGKRCKDQVVKIQDKMRVNFQGANFHIEILWRRETNKRDYQYETRRATEARDKTSLQTSLSESTSSHTIWVETFEDYELTKIYIDNEKIDATQLMRKDCSYFVAKRYKALDLKQRELRFWRKIKRNVIEHVSSRSLKTLLTITNISLKV